MVDPCEWLYGYIQGKKPCEVTKPCLLLAFTARDLLSLRGINLSHLAKNGALLLYLGNNSVLLSLKASFKFSQNIKTETCSSYLCHHVFSETIYLVNSSPARLFHSTPNNSFAKNQSPSKEKIRASHVISIFPRLSSSLSPSPTNFTFQPLSLLHKPNLIHFHSIFHPSHKPQKPKQFSECSRKRSSDRV